MARTAKRYQKAETGYKQSGLPVFYAGIYSRVSVDSGENKTETIENQIEIARQFVRENNSSTERKMDLQIYDTYIDRGITGTSFDRKGFMRLMEDVKGHKINCIIVKDLSRFGRNYLEVGNYLEKVFPYLGVRFISVNDQFDTLYSSNQEVFMVPLKSIIHDIYAKDISKEILYIAEKSLIEMNTGEEKYLDAIKEYTLNGICPADVIIRNWNGLWNKDVKKLIKYISE